MKKWLLFTALLGVAGIAPAPPAHPIRITGMNTCSMVAKTSTTNSCGSHPSCGGSCRTANWDQASCSFNPLDECRVQLQNAYVSYSDVSCTPTGYACNCSGAPLGSGNYLATIDRCV